MTERDTEEAILNAAHAVFLRRGTAGARMQEVADEAGVNKALLHYYFRSKNRLAEAVFQRATRRLFPPVLVTLGSDLPLEEKVRAVVDAVVEVLTESPFLAGYLMSEMHHHPERLDQLLATTIAGISPRRLVPPIIAKLRKQIDERVATGTLRPITPDQFIVNLVALCLFPFAARPMLKVLLAHGEDGFDRMLEERRHSLADFFLNALRP